MHTFATLIAGFVRPYILRVSAPRDGYEAGAAPSLYVYGFRWFAAYSALIILIHHTALFYIEVFRLADFFSTLLRVLLSSIFSLTSVLLIEFARKNR
jgi:hypothetical protein